MPEWPMLEWLVEVQSIAQAVLLGLTLLVAPALAIWRGGGPERACTLALVARAMLQDITTGTPLATGGGPGEAAIDVLVLGALVGIALKANRFYPLVLASCALIAVIGHALDMARLVADPLAHYAALVEGPALIALPALLVGILAHIRRQERIGAYPDWRPDLA